MAKGSDEFLSYEQVLQELQINRSRLNQLIREGRLTEQLVEGETKFRMVEVQDIRRTMEKSPTVMEESDEDGEPETDLLEDQKPAVSSEPATEIIVEGDDEGVARATDLLDEIPSAEAARETLMLEDEAPERVTDRDTEILEDGGDEFDLELPSDADSAELRTPLTEDSAASETALETELELKAAGPGEEDAKEEDFFDFTDALDSDEFELEAAPEEPRADAVPELLAEEDDEDVVTDILQLGSEEEVPEEDLLSEIMDIDEEQAAGAAATADETEDITAEITTLDEPVYEESDLGEVIGAGEAEEVDFGDIEASDAFEVPYAEPIEVGEASVGTGVFVGLVLILVVMALAALFVMENGSRPDFATPLTQWASGLF